MTEPPRKDENPDAEAVFNRTGDVILRVPS